MDIKTKLNRGDEAYFMCNNKVCCAEIIGIRVEVTCNMYDVDVIEITYQIQRMDITESYHESELFPSKEELLKSL